MSLLIPFLVCAVVVCITLVVTGNVIPALIFASAVALILVFRYRALHVVRE